MTELKTESPEGLTCSVTDVTKTEILLGGYEVASSKDHIDKNIRDSKIPTICPILIKKIEDKQIPQDGIFKFHNEYDNISLLSTYNDTVKGDIRRIYLPQDMITKLEIPCGFGVSVYYQNT